MTDRNGTTPTSGSTPAPQPLPVREPGATLRNNPAIATPAPRIWDGWDDPWGPAARHAFGDPR